MSGIVLKPWEFETDDKVELYWFGAPFRDKKGRWKIRVLFRKTSGEFCIEYYPWGLLPALHIGQTYMAGVACPETRGGTGTLKITPDTNFKICDGFSLPQSLYSFKNHPHYGQQKLCTFTIGKITYFLPCIEIIRMLAPYNVLMNQIFYPKGLETLIESCDGGRERYKLLFSHKFPSSLLNDTCVSHMSWLLFSPKALNAWHSVYRNIFLKESAEEIEKDNLQKVLSGFPIVLTPPVENEEVWNFRGLAEGNNIIIVDVARTKIKHPCRKVEYSSLKLKTLMEVDDPRRFREKGDPVGIIPFVTQDESGVSPTGTSEPVYAEIDIPGFQFKQMPAMKKVKNYTGKKRTGEKLPEGNVEGIDVSSTSGSLERIGSAVDWERGGSLRSIEFRPFRNSMQFPPGLEDFLKMVSYLQKNRRDWIVSVNFAGLGRKRKYVDKGRICAIVQVSGKDIGTNYLIEMSRMNDLFVSTLLVKPNYSLENPEKMLIKNLSILSGRYFHWDRELLKEGRKEFKFWFLKHSSKEIERWGIRITEKIFEGNDSAL